MILTIDIKESAYEKVMYLLNHLKDDVEIVQEDTFTKELANKKEKALRDFENGESVKWNDLKKEIL
ncbi:MAG: hypothetical protein HXX81_04145 [Campylobacterales bacterium]|nr:hypothetical protein [Campylobacterales bacterium]